MKSASARTSVSIEVYDTRKGDMTLCAIFFGKNHNEAKARAQEYAEFKAQESNARLAKLLMINLALGFVCLAVALLLLGLSKAAWAIPGVMLGQASSIGLIWWKERKS